MKEKFFAFRFSIQVFILLFFALPYVIWGQEAGLAFRSYEKVQNERTSLLFSPAFDLEKDAEILLTFDLKFKANQLSYYGYVFRMILDKQFNIDLVCDDFSKNNQTFSLVVGDQQYILKLPNTTPDPYGWLPVQVKISQHSQEVEIKVNNIVQTARFGYKGKGQAQLSFGANVIAGFSNTDVPPMYVRDLQIRQQGQLLSRWLLAESRGQEVADSLGRITGMVTNPNWIKALHTRWQLLADIKLGHASSVAFDKVNERVIFIGDTALHIVDLASNSVQNIIYSSGPLGLQAGNQSIFVSETNTLYNFFPDEPIVNVFDFKKRSWRTSYKKREKTAFWHANKFYSPVDSAIYLLGGYGYFTYKGGLMKASLRTGQFDTLFTSDPAYAPRYLSSVGSTSDGVYIFGGFGSKSGKQGLNPHHYYDMLYFDFKTQHLRKLWELPPRTEEFVLGNSLWIDSINQQFYALTYPKNIFDSAIKLVRGSLLGGPLTALADSIPFRFQDINSFADLFFADKNEQLIAVTLYDDGTEVHAQLYGLYFPPMPLTEISPPSHPHLTWIMIGGAFALVASMWLLRKKKQRPVPSYSLMDSTPEQTGNKVYLFGNFQVVDKRGVDITKEFTPVLKQLFLFIVLQTILNKAGASSERLYELLWSDKDTKSARNNLLVNIGKLKNVLGAVEGIHLSKDTGYWQFQFDNNLRVDLNDFWRINITQQSLLEQMLLLSGFLERGAFLMDMDFEWMDEAKGLVASKVTDSYIIFLKKYPVHEFGGPHLIIAKRIGHYDLMNEEAMMVRCFLLSQMGSHQEAKQAYESFATEYQKLYDQEYDVSFKEIIVRY
ncbi:hypothetical protein [Sphingobacterium faecale]|uniref:DNA-binding SARP family transcriptional activator n=1 Tax=Sphingobacterium faecale TaxID=2803775 RepID=A0ABS1R885_9SPHI|nr:hypothetical protein [Sphingobacterium faecale]MBL1410439.1 hypothetical protein [Sphingobacterium faecale]